MSTSDEPHILLVEDDKEVARDVTAALREAGMSLDHAPTLSAAFDLVAARTFDVIVLDLGLPDGNGLELAKAVRRKRQDVPLLMLTARSAAQHRLDGFAHGADDYVCKPFLMEELVARVKALLRRSRPAGHHLLRYAGVELDLIQRVARRNDSEIVLSDREAALLTFLMRHPDEPLSRETLAQEVWGLDEELGRGVVNVYINYLRNKLEQGDRESRLIHTIRGVGYILSATPPD